MKIQRNRWNWFMTLGLFVVVFSFAFLAQKFNSEHVDAANMGAFDPGYIISDYQMGYYTSMSESEIQNFLKSKNSCNDTNTGKTGNNVGYLSESTPYSWHVNNGHYVCMADENFNGESAAHIIWQAAQDYRINPQVLIVLLQKEQGLVTDTFPNSVQYRSAMGYGCPDTAACSSKYYGFKNQVRNAAALFREVLDGGWTNYPVGNNYIKYNPDASCGGSIVNVKNLATSALYRYTPYQPNRAALNGGRDSCSAYGNRNFYGYFEDWFGNIKGMVWQKMSNPRIMKVVTSTLRVNPTTLTVYSGQWANLGYKFYFTSKTDIFWGSKKVACLRTLEDTNKNIDRCIIMDRMIETDEALYDVENNEEVVLLVNNDTYKYDLKTNSRVQELRVKDYYGIRFAMKVTYNDKEYYQTRNDVLSGKEAFVPAKDLKEIKFTNFANPRYMATIKEANFINLGTSEICKIAKVGYVNKFTTKIDVGGSTYFRTIDDSNEGNNCVINAKFVQNTENIGQIGGDVANFKNFAYPRKLYLAKIPRQNRQNHQDH